MGVNDVTATFKNLFVATKERVNQQKAIKTWYVH